MRFREIRNTEKVTDRFDSRINNSLFDKRITDEEIENCNKFWEEEFKKQRDLFEQAVVFADNLDTRV